MKAIYTRHEVISDDLFGDDILRFKIYFKTETHPEFALPISPCFDTLKQHIEEHDKDVYTYLSGIRKTIQGYGPKHSKVFDILNNEGFDMLPHIIHFLESIFEEGIQRHVDLCYSIVTPTNQIDMEAKLKRLNNAIPSNARQYGRTLNEFTDQLDINIHETVLQFFPELLEKGEKHTKAYKYELISLVLNFSSHIDRLMHDNFNPYWEEIYNARNNS